MTAGPIYVLQESLTLAGHGEMMKSRSGGPHTSAGMVAMEATSIDDEIPIQRALRRDIRHSIGNVRLPTIVQKHGRAFRPQARPKGFRLRAQQQCFLNSFHLADAERGIYVEGFAMVNGQHFHHAWVTLDGVHAVDVTLRSPEEAQFFGIAFSLPTLRKQICGVRKGKLPMLDPYQPMETLEALVEAGTVSFSDTDANDLPALSI
ncbi:hypothetical protein [Bradyrhizobium elkanii]|uniref:hypothetical protein n=1 Tax=Bradyrhizobium elkanii TaxID=29448 RepID=UPI00056DDD06|nr:hypothetical protein [Bradyrhizobium elkanii]WLA83223.1 hypothetical protein QNJ99_02450 [Bradyrhizobium elkanii]